MTAALHPRNPAAAHLEDAPLPDDVAYDDVGYDADDLLKMTPAGTPVPGQEMDPPYRCPVSTPANFVRPSPRVRRTKPMPVSLEITLTPRSPTKRSAGGKPPRPGATAPQRTLSHHSGGGGGKLLSSGGEGGARASMPLAAHGVGKGKGSGGVGGALNSRSLQYYYVDKAEEQREAAETNTFWLKALCSQPVTEILDKYKRRSDLRRTRLLWSKTYTTPGERSLLRAWERNGPPVMGLPAAAHLHPLFRSHDQGGGGGVPRSADPHHPHSHHSRSHSRSFGGGAARSRSSGSGLAPLGLHRHQSEPFDRSRGYPSDEGEDDTEDDEEEEAQFGSSTMSAADADVSFNSPRSSSQHHRLQLSPRQRSPCGGGSSSGGEYRLKRSPQQHQHQHQQSSSEKEGFSVGRYPGVLLPNGNGVVAHPCPEPAYHLSDHFQVSLPSVGAGRRGRWEGRGSPTTRRSFSLTRDRRRRPIGDLLSTDPVTSHLSEASPRESTTTAGSTIPPDTPRSGGGLRTTLPAIFRA